MREMYLRLALARLRSRRIQFAVLFLVAVLGCAIALSALALRGAASGPWQRLFAETNGAHVTVQATSPDAVTDAAARPEVSAATEVIARHQAAVDIGGRLLQIQLVRAPDRDQMTVDRPAVLDGRWLGGDGEVVLEMTMAEALGARVGDQIRFGGREPVVLRVAGTAATAGRGANYPAVTPGMGWVTAATFDGLHLAGDGEPIELTVGLRLHDPDRAAPLAAALAADTRWPDRQVWTAADDRFEATIAAEIMRVIVLGYTLLLLVGAVLLVFILLGSRVVSESRQVALLQVAGVTPRQLSTVLAVEHAIIALAGAAVGTLVALAVAPLLARAATSALGTVPPTISPTQITVVAAVAVAAGALAGAIAAIRVGRTSLAVVAGGATLARRSRLSSLAAALSLPAWFVLGVKDAFARPGRAILIVLSLALALLTTVVVITAGASISPDATTDATVAAGATLATPPNELPALPPGLTASTGVLKLFRVLQVLLSLVALANVLAAALMSARERTRELSVLEATGFSSRHLVAAATTSHGLLALPAALIGLPLGFAIVAGMTADIEGTVYPGAGEVALVVLAAAAIAGLLAALPVLARRRHSLAHALAVE
jgi:putative ABC transport system permease protein